MSHRHRAGDVDDVQQRSRFSQEGHNYGIETKTQLSQWKRPEEPKPKKARQFWLNVKVLLTVCFLRLQWRGAS